MIIGTRNDVDRERKKSDLMTDPKEVSNYIMGLGFKFHPISLPKNTDS